MLLCDRVIRAIDSSESESVDVRVDWVDLDWNECRRRALRKRSRNGRLVRILPRVGVTLRHGDVLAESSDWLLAVSVTRCEVLVAKPTTLEQAAGVALMWGNLHLPVEIAGDEISTLVDGPALEALDHFCVPFTTERRRFHPTTVPGLIVGDARRPS